MMKGKFSLQISSNDSLHYVNSSLNIFQSTGITLFILKPWSVSLCLRCLWSVIASARASRPRQSPRQHQDSDRLCLWCRCGLQEFVFRSFYYPWADRWNACKFIVVRMEASAPPSAVTDWTVFTFPLGDGWTAVRRRRQSVSRLSVLQLKKQFLSLFFRRKQNAGGTAWPCINLFNYNIRMPYIWNR
jgi:hypothetical protein